MVDKWGVEIEAVLDSPDAVAKLRQCSGIGQKTAETIKRGWDMNRGGWVGGWVVGQAARGKRGKPPCPHAGSRLTSLAPAPLPLSLLLLLLLLLLSGGQVATCSVPPAGSARSSSTLRTYIY